MLTYELGQSTSARASRPAAAFRFGYNGYSALTWRDGADPRPDYYRAMPSYQLFRWAQSETPESSETYLNNYREILRTWTGRMDWDGFYRTNMQTDPASAGGMSAAAPGSHFSNTIVEERHTDQLDFNFAASVAHTFRNNTRLVGGLRARINRTEYYDEVKDLLGGDFWLDVDKFAMRDMGESVLAYQNDLDYYYRHGHAKMAKEGDKISYATTPTCAMRGCGRSTASRSAGSMPSWAASWATRPCGATVCGARVSSPMTLSATRRRSTTSPTA